MKQEPSVLEWNSNKDILVLILGWAGAADKHLKKYSELYKSYGLSTLRYTAFFDGYNRNIYCLAPTEIDSLLDDFAIVYNKKHVKLIIHSMSMNGIMCLTSLMNCGKFPDVFERTIGIVFDSCPIYENSPGGYREVLNFQIGNYFGDSYLGQLKKTATMWVLLGKKAYDYYEMKFKHNLLGYELKDMIQYHYLAEHPKIPHRQLYLYSDADIICSSWQIQQFHEKQLHMGRDVTYRNFVDSPHVEHAKTYPAEYQKLLHDFVFKVIGSNDKSKL
ncbi:unnamed protein product, partial [Mesorhabditis spiculigera]